MAAVFGVVRSQNVAVADYCVISTQKSCQKVGHFCWLLEQHLPEKTMSAISKNCLNSNGICGTMDNGTPHEARHSAREIAKCPKQH